MPKFLHQLALLVLFLSSSSFIVNAQTIRYVKPTATGTGDGLSWANASGDLQAMIDASAANNEVWVAAGTYKPDRYPTGCTNCTGRSNLDYAFILKNKVKIYGGFIGSEASLIERTVENINNNPSILSGDIYNTSATIDDLYHVLLSVNDDNTTVFDGFIVTKGNANQVTSKTIEGKTVYDNYGGGFYSNNSSLIINNCKFTYNKSFDGGGGLFNTISGSKITNCIFSNNTGGEAAGIMNSYNTSTFSIVNCIFINNYSSIYYTGITAGGGGIENISCSPKISNCSFFNNYSFSNGGAINNVGSLSNPVITNCIFWGNSKRNSLTVLGADIDNQGGGLATIKYSSLQLTNASIYPSSFINISTSNNIFAQNPLFASSDNLTLQKCSPAINTGTNTSVTTNFDIAGNTRIQNSIIDMGAYESPYLYSTDASATNNSPINAGSTLTLTSSGGTSYSWIGPNSFSSTNQNASIDNSRISMSGIYTVTVTNTNSCISTATTTTNVIINPYAVAENNSPICEGNTLNLSSSNGISYIWTGPNGFSSTNQNPIIPTSTISLSGIYTITLTNNFGSIETATTSVIVQAKPSPPTIISPENISVCSPNTLTLAATGCDGIVNWSNNATGTSLMLSEIGTYSISANCSQNGCVSEQSSTVSGLEIKAKPNPPTIISPENLSACSPNTLTLTATGCDGIVTWSNNATGTSLTISEIGTYSISANCTQNGCTSEQSLVVSGLEIKEKPNQPTIISLENLSVCSPNSLTLTATGCAGIVTWSNNATGTSLMLSEIGTYSISANCSQNGCVSEQSLVVSGLEIKEKPNQPTIISLENLSVCSPNSLTLTATGCAGIVTWSNNATGTSLILSEVGTYSISANCKQNGCISEQSSTVSGLEIKAKPSPPTIIPPENLSVCSPNTLTLTATGCDGIVTWSNNSTGTSLTISEAGTYSISANCSVNDCISEQSSAVSGLEIKAKPSPPTIIPPENLSVCSPNTLTLTATGCDGIITWSNNSTGTSLILSEVGTYAISVNCSLNGCISEQSSVVSGLEIRAKPNPPTISAEPSTINFGENASLSAIGCEGLIQWSLGGFTTNPLIVKLDVTASFTATCTQNNCQSETSSIVTVTINDNPCQNQVTLVSSSDDYSTGIYQKSASSIGGKIIATNKITGIAKIFYNAKSIELNAGFKAENGTLFTAEIGGCN